MNDWMNAWTNEWTCGCVAELMCGWVVACMCAWMIVCIDGWINASHRSRTEDMGNVCVQSARRANPTYGSVDSACAIKHNTYQARVISAMCWFCVCKWVWLNAFTVPQHFGDVETEILSGSIRPTYIPQAVLSNINICVNKCAYRRCCLS